MGERCSEGGGILWLIVGGWGHTDAGVVTAFGAFSGRELKALYDWGLATMQAVYADWWIVRAKGPTIAWRRQRFFVRRK